MSRAVRFAGGAAVAALLPFAATQAASAESVGCTDYSELPAWQQSHPVKACVKVWVEDHDRTLVRRVEFQAERRDNAPYFITYRLLQSDANHVIRRQWPTGATWGGFQIPANTIQTLTACSYYEAVSNWDRPCRDWPNGWFLSAEILLGGTVNPVMRTANVEIKA